MANYNLGTLFYEAGVKVSNLDQAKELKDLLSGLKNRYEITLDVAGMNILSALKGDVVELGNQFNKTAESARTIEDSLRRAFSKGDVRKKAVREATSDLREYEDVMMKSADRQKRFVDKINYALSETNFDIFRSKLGNVIRDSERFVSEYEALHNALSVTRNNAVEEGFIGKNSLKTLKSETDDVKTFVDSIKTSMDIARNALNNRKLSMEEIKKAFGDAWNDIDIKKSFNLVERMEKQIASAFLDMGQNATPAMRQAFDNLRKEMSKNTSKFHLDNLEVYINRIHPGKDSVNGFYRELKSALEGLNAVTPIDVVVKTRISSNSGNKENQNDGLIMGSAFYKAKIEDARREYKHLDFFKEWENSIGNKVTAKAQEKWLILNEAIEKYKKSLEETSKKEETLSLMQNAIAAGNELTALALKEKEGIALTNEELARKAQLVDIITKAASQSQSATQSQNITSNQASNTSSLKKDLAEIEGLMNNIYNNRKIYGLSDYQPIKKGFYESYSELKKLQDEVNNSTGETVANADAVKKRVDALRDYIKSNSFFSKDVADPSKSVLPDLDSWSNKMNSDLTNARKQAFELDKILKETTLPKSNGVNSAVSTIFDKIFDSGSGYNNGKSDLVNLLEEQRKTAVVVAEDLIRMSKAYGDDKRAEPLKGISDSIDQTSLKTNELLTNLLKVKDNKGLEKLEEDVRKVAREFDAASDKAEKMLAVLGGINKRAEGGLLDKIARLNVNMNDPVSVGGKIVGPGTGTSDSIHLFASRGEYVVNAKSTAMFEKLLDYINALGVGKGSVEQLEAALQNIRALGIGLPTSTLIIEGARLSDSSVSEIKSQVEGAVSNIDINRKHNAALYRSTGGPVTPDSDQEILIKKSKELKDQYETASESIRRCTIELEQLKKQKDVIDGRSNEGKAQKHFIREEERELNALLVYQRMLDGQYYSLTGTHFGQQETANVSKNTEEINKNTDALSKNNAERNSSNSSSDRSEKERLRAIDAEAKMIMRQQQMRERYNQWVKDEGGREAARGWMGPNVYGTMDYQSAMTSMKHFYEALEVEEKKATELAERRARQMTEGMNEIYRGRELYNKIMTDRAESIVSFATNGRSSNNLYAQLRDAERISNQIQGSIKHFEGVKKDFKDYVIKDVNGVSINVDNSDARNKIQAIIDKLLELQQLGSSEMLSKWQEMKDTKFIGNSMEEVRRSAKSAKEHADAQKQAAAEAKKAEDAARRQSEENRKSAEAAEKLAEKEKKVADEAARAVQNASAFNNQTSQAVKNIFSLDQQFSQLAMTLQNTVSLMGLQQLAKEVISVGGELEKQQLAMNSILGSAGRSAEIFAKVSDLSMISPFTVQDLVKNTKQLAAFGVEYDKLYDTVKRLSDISAAVGVDFSRIAYEYGQMETMGYLDRRHLRMFSMSGIPLSAELRKYYSNQSGKEVSQHDIDKMIMKREVSADVVKSILKDMTNESGKFFNMQEVMAESLSAKYANLTNAWNLMLGQMAVGAPGDMLKDLVTILTEFTEQWESISKIGFSALALVGINKISLLLRMATTQMGDFSTKTATEISNQTKLQAQLLRTKSLYTDLTSEERNRMANGGKVTTSALQQRFSKSTEGLSRIERQNQIELNKVTAAQLFLRKQITAEQLKSLNMFTGNEMQNLGAMPTKIGSAFKVISIDIKNGVTSALNGIKKSLGGINNDIRAAGGFSSYAGMNMIKTWNLAKLSLIGVAGAARSLGGALMSIALNPYTWIFALVGGITSFVQKSKEAKQQLEDLTLASRNKGFEGLQKTFESIEKINFVSLSDNGINASKVFKGLSSDELKENIESMKEFLKENDNTYGELFKEVFAVNEDDSSYILDQTEQCEKLYQRVLDVKDAYEKLKDTVNGTAGIAAAALADTDDAGFDDMLDENMKDLSKASLKFNMETSKLFGKYNNDIVAAFKEYASKNQDALASFGDIDKINTSSQILNLVKDADNAKEIINGINDVMMHTEGLASTLKSQFKDGFKIIGTDLGDFVDDYKSAMNDMRHDAETFWNSYSKILESRGYDLSNLSTSDKMSIRWDIEAALDEKQVQGVGRDAFMKLLETMGVIPVKAEFEEFKIKNRSEIQQELIKSINTGEINVDLGPEFDQSKVDGIVKILEGIIDKSDESVDIQDNLNKALKEYKDKVDKLGPAILNVSKNAKEATKSMDEYVSNNPALKQMLSEYRQLAAILSQIYNLTNKINNPANKYQEGLLGKLGNYKDTELSISEKDFYKRIENAILSSSSMYDEQEAIKTIYSDVEKRKKQLSKVNPKTGKSNKDSEEYAELVRVEERLNEIAKTGNFSLEEDKGSKGAGKKDKTFKEKLNDQIRLVQEAYREYKRWYDLLGNRSGAEAKLLENGILTELFDENGFDKNAYNVEDLKKNLETIRASIADALTKKLITPEDKKNLELSISKVFSNLGFDYESDLHKKAMDKFKEEIDRDAKNFDFQKKIFESTGDAEWARRAAEENLYVWDELARKWFEELKARSGKEEIPLNLDSVSAEELLGKDLVDLYTKLKERLESNAIDVKTTATELLDVLPEAIKHQNNLNKLTANYKKNIEKTSDIHDRNLFTLKYQADTYEEMMRYWKENPINAFKMDNLQYMSKGDLEALRKSLTDEFSGFEGKIPAEKMKEYYDSLKKIDEEELNKKVFANVFKYAKTATTSLEAYNKKVKEREAAEKSLAEKRQQLEDDKYVLSEEAIQTYKTEIQNLEQEVIKLSNEEGIAAIKAATDAEMVQKSVESLGKSIAKVGDIISEIGGAIGGDLGSSIGSLGGILNSAGDIGSKIAGGGLDMIGGIVTGVVKMYDLSRTLDDVVTNAVNGMFEHDAEKQASINAMKDAVYEYAAAIKEADIEERNWFGTTAFTDARDAIDKASVLLNAYNAKMDEWQEAYKDKKHGGWGNYLAAGLSVAAGTALAIWTGGASLPASYALAVGLTTTASVAAGAAAAGMYAAAEYTAEWLNYSNGLVHAYENLRIVTRKASNGFWGTGWGGNDEVTQDLQSYLDDSKTIYDAMLQKMLGEIDEKQYRSVVDSVGYASKEKEAIAQAMLDLGLNDLKLFDEDGIINSEVANILLESGRLTEQTEETIKFLISKGDDVKEMYKELDAAASKLFSPLMDNFTNAIWDWFDDGKDVMDSFYEYSSDTFRDIANEMIKTLLMDEVFSKYKTQLRDIMLAFGDGGDYNAMVNGVAGVAQGMANDLSTMSPAIQELLKQLDQALKDAGYANGLAKSDNGSKSSSDVKSDFANLLKDINSTISDFTKSLKKQFAESLIDKLLDAPEFKDKLDNLNSDIQSFIDSVDASTSRTDIENKLNEFATAYANMAKDGLAKVEMFFKATGQWADYFTEKILGISFESLKDNLSGALDGSKDAMDNFMKDFKESIAKNALAKLMDTSGFNQQLENFMMSTAISIENNTFDKDRFESNYQSLLDWLAGMIKQVNEQFGTGVTDIVEETLGTSFDSLKEKLASSLDGTKKAMKSLLEDLREEIAKKALSALMDTSGFNNALDEFTKNLADSIQNGTFDKGAFEKDYGSLLDWLSELINGINETFGSGLEDALERTTMTSLDSFLSNITSSLSDVSKTIEDMMEDIRKSMLSASLNHWMDTSGMNDRLEQWRKMWAEAEDNGTIDQKREELLALYEEIMREIKYKSDEYAEGYGIETNKEGTLSSSIKGVTEETANILAAYMNAIRQDVSVERYLLEQIVGHLGIIEDNTTDEFTMGPDGVYQSALRGFSPIDEEEGVPTTLDLYMQSIAYEQLPMMNMTAASQLAQLEMQTEYLRQLNVVSQQISADLSSMRGYVSGIATGSYAVKVK